MEENLLTATCELMLIGGSAGSLEVLFKLLPLLRTDLPFPLALILHRRSSGDSSLSDLLGSKTLNPTHEVEDKEPIVPGTIYLAPADYHLLIEHDRTFSLDYSEKVHFSRPSIDVTFESAAEVYGRGLVGILLSGANEDGTEGLAAIKNAGGTAVVQDPDTAQMPFMPHYAMTHLRTDHVLNTIQMAAFINSLG
ncbi:putative chemotaxis protein-glutamate methylesterase [Dyadobacter beijingensis]|uniref:protein-glutamate methylesterase n=1 Tax=Dyadobacter beijingensis TaxID=365489 RepID=A0ABQ2HSF9_9BACT|nr:chemotaxis protein CheB [Dyadobacter beijingensis]GGM88733.1 putative chemotaxis protein-glutamate methylesterase [Dyadobacter beijingensis]